MKDNSLDILNIFLMLISAVLAYYLPFKLFLFSYAVLGPLHYLTEISWLDKKNYFTKFRYDFVMLLVIGLCLSAQMFLRIPYADSFMASIMFFAFFASLVMVTVESSQKRVFSYAGIAVLSLVLKGLPLFYTLFATILPTLAHVFIFTGCFILYGALVNKNRTGLLSVLVYVACFIGLFFATVDPSLYTVSTYIQGVYSAFAGVNVSIMNLLHINNPNTEWAIFSSAAGLSIMRCIAFAYTYHYLNWFSKTRIIRWHDVSVLKLVSVIGIWVLSIALYLYDYRQGIMALFFLSLLHVLLEFPLNHKTFIGIGREVKKLITK